MIPPKAANVSNGWPANASTAASHTQMPVATAMPSAVPSRRELWSLDRETIVMPRSRENVAAVRGGNVSRLIFRSSGGGSRVRWVVWVTDEWLVAALGGGNQAVVLGNGTRVSYGRFRRRWQRHGARRQHVGTVTSQHPTY